MCSVVSKRDWQGAAFAYADEPLGARLLDCRLDPKPRSHHRLHPQVGMLKKILQTLVRLGKGVGLFTSIGRGFGRRCNIKSDEYLCKLWIAHHVLKVDVGIPE